MSKKDSIILYKSVNLSNYTVSFDSFNKDVISWDNDPVGLLFQQHGYDKTRPDVLERLIGTAFLAKTRDINKCYPTNLEKFITEYKV